MTKYDHKAIEQKWQEAWEKEQIYKASDSSKKPKKYVLIEFPYPSGEGLHMGHLRPYTAGDVYSRYLRMQGYEVLYPIGWDAFGLPAENFAIKNKVHPSISTAQNIANAKKQLHSWGMSFDWSREINTTDPLYYKWTQWIFLQFFKAGLTFEATGLINWCPVDKTGLANEEVVDGRCERCGTLVETKEIRQWYLKITAYAEKLLKGLENLDWPEPIKLMQSNWIGKSEGVTFKFKVKDLDLKFEMYDSVPQTFMAQTFTVIAPEHPMVYELVKGTKHEKPVMDFVEKVKAKKLSGKFDIEKDMEGIFTGRYVDYTIGNRLLPIWVASFVVYDYGTGIVNASAHDERDFAFAKKYNLPLHPVMFPPKKAEAEKIRNLEYAYVKDPNGILEEPAEFKGMTWAQARKPIIDFIEKKGVGKASVNYKIRDWVFSRQRYWGEPIPLIHCERCATQKSVLVVHGVMGSSRENWFPWIKNVLGNHGWSVSVPDLPNADHPVIEEWNNALKHELKEDSVVVGHSLGAPAALNLVQSAGKKISKLILVAPVNPKQEWKNLKSEYSSVDWDAVRAFANIKFGWKKISKLTNQVIIYYSDNDKFIPEESIAFYKEHIPNAVFKFHPGSGHFNQSAGMTEFPEILTEFANPGVFPVPEDELPVTLPEVKQYEPTGTGESPLAAIDSWVNVKCPKCGGPAKRETNTMPQWAGSSWYWLRYTDPKNDKELASKKLQKHWTPVDVYFGGMEHTTLHLLYSRFWNLFLYDQGHVTAKEPYIKRVPHGIVSGPDGEKMSKSRGNVVNPDDVVAKYGADVLRMYEMFLGPHGDTVSWNDQGIVGVARFLEKVWRLGSSSNFLSPSGGEWPKAERGVHILIKKITADIEAFKFNTAIASFMEFLNNNPTMSKGDWVVFLRLLAPFAPHITEELWHQLGHKDSIHQQPWPKFDPKLAKEEKVTIVVQVSGKVRTTLEMEAGSSQEEVKKAALADPNVQKHLGGKKKVKEIFVPDKLINFVIK